MPETPKEKPEPEIADESCSSVSWAEDQKKREYYYDDAHGYEVYIPNEELDGKTVEIDESTEA